jgi:hypothetical protein
MSELHSQIPVIELHTEQLMQMPELQDRYKELGSWDWTIGHTPEFSHTVEHSFPWGFVVRVIASFLNIFRAFHWWWISSYLSNEATSVHKICRHVASNATKVLSLSALLTAPLCHCRVI